MNNENYKIHRLNMHTLCHRFAQYKRYKDILERKCSGPIFCACKFLKEFSSKIFLVFKKFKICYFIMKDCNILRKKLYGMKNVGLHLGEIAKRENNDLLIFFQPCPLHV